MNSTDLRMIFSRNLNNIMQKKKKSQADIVRDLKLGQSTVSSWMLGIKYPRIDKMQLLADYFGVSITDLVGEEAEEAGKKMIHRTTHLEERFDSMIQELSLRQADFYLDDVKLDDEDITILQSMIESYVSMVRTVIKGRHAK